MPLPFFGKKDDGKTPATGPGAPPTGGDAPAFSAEKAAKFFQHARTVHDSTNYEYAAQLWLSGLRLDPHSMNGLESFLKSAAAHNGEHPKGFSKDTLRAFEGGKNDVERYLHALIAWANSKFQDPALAVRAAESAAKLSLPEPAHYLGSAALNLARADKKPRKELLLRLMEAFKLVAAFDKAVEAGEAAVRLDPADGRLAADVRNLAAQATMSSGGYDQSGQAGGFRKNVRDLEKQRQLEEGDRIVKTEDAHDRLVADAAAEYERRPDDAATVTLYIKRLLERGKDEDEKRARDVAAKAYDRSKEFRFRETVGDINLRRAARKLAAYRDAARASPADPAAQDTHRRAREQFLKMELDEFKLRIDAYPTESKYKYEVARRALELGDTDTAIPLLQRSAEDARYRTESLRMLGEAFARIDYTDEAVHAFREALASHKVATDETGMSLNYGLLTALQAKGERERDLAAIAEADRIASALALQQFNYKDIRQRRDTIKKLLSDLKSGAPPA